MDRPKTLPLSERVAREAERRGHRVTDVVRPLSMEVSIYLNLRIGRSEPGMPGALVVNHGEQVNLGQPGIDHQPALAFLAEPRKGALAI